MLAYNDRLIIVDYHPFPGDPDTKFNIRVREIDPEATLDTGWYENVVRDSQGSLVLKEENGKLNIYAYDRVSKDNRRIVKATYRSEKRWSRTSPIRDVSMGRTGPFTASLDGKLYRFLDALPDSQLDPSLSDTNGYLQECVPGPVSQACWFSPTPAAINNSNGLVRSDGGLSGQVYLLKNNTYTNVGYLESSIYSQTGSFSIPATVLPGTYELTVGNNPGIICKHPSGQATVDVQSADAQTDPDEPPTLCYDMDGDGEVTKNDAQEILNHFGEEGANLKWDLNEDDVVDLSDSLLVLEFEGRKC